MMVRHPFIRVVTVLAVLALIVAVGNSPVAAEPRSTSERRLFADAADRKLDDFTLLEAGLIASGAVDQPSRESYAERCRKPLSALADDLKNVEDTAARAERVFDCLHQEFLVGEYDERCTEITRLLDHGDYNCVSATLLYQYLCRSFELAPTAVATSTHVRSRFDESDPFDVETTCRDWFNVGESRCRDRICNSHQPTRRLDDVQLLGKIYYNRGVSKLEAEQFAEAVRLLRVARRFDPQDASAEENLLAATNNWALFECRRGNFRQAVQLIEQGLASSPKYAPFLANDLHIHQRWATHLCQEQRFSKALAILERAYQRRPEVELFDRGRLAVTEQWDRALLQADDD